MATLVPPTSWRTSPEDLVRRFFDAYEQRDVGALLALSHPEIVLTALTDGRTYRGLDEVGEFFARRVGGRRRTEVSVAHVVEDGAQLLVHGRIRTIDDGRLVDSPATWVFEVRDELIAHIAPGRA